MVKKQDKLTVPMILGPSGGLKTYIKQDDSGDVLLWDDNSESSICISFLDLDKVIQFLTEVNNKK